MSSSPSTFFGLDKSDDGKKLKLFIRDIDVSYVNAIRRIILSEIPNIGIRFDSIDIAKSDIIINKNTCALHNEFLGHRISLVPLCFDSDEIESFDPKHYNFVLQKKNITSEIINVTSEDINIFDEQGKSYPSSYRDKIFPKSPITGDYILLTKLKPNLYDLGNGEEIDIEFTAVKDIAQTHSRWCPVSQCSYGNVIDQEAADAAFAAKVEKHENDTGKKVTTEQKRSMLQQFNTLDAYRHFKKNRYDEPSEFEFMIETECRLTPTYLFGKAWDILRNKLESFSEKLINNEYPIKKLNISENFYEIEIKDETYTLLNVLQSNIYNYNFRQQKDTSLEYIGYYQPHPLDTTLILKIKFKPSVQEKDMLAYTKQFMDSDIKKMIEEVDRYIAEWHSAIKP